MADHTRGETRDTAGGWVVICSCSAVCRGRDEDDAKAAHDEHATAAKVADAASRVFGER